MDVGDDRDRQEVDRQRQLCVSVGTGQRKPTFVQTDRYKTNLLLQNRALFYDSICMYEVGLVVFVHVCATKHYICILCLSDIKYIK